MGLVFHPLLEITEDDLKKARECYNMDETSIRLALDAIEAWCAKQDHLIEAFKLIKRSALERVFLLSRGSTEMSKKRIEKLFTMRGIMPEMCANISIDEFDDIFLNVIPLPKLNPIDLSRVTIIYLIKENNEQFNILSFMRYCIMIGEFRVHYDYNLGDTFILDLKNVHISILTKLNPVTLKRSHLFATEGYGTKIKGIHLLNAPSFVDKFLFIFKQGFKGKVAKRIYVHSTYEDLHKHIPKEILPKEYGGDTSNFEKIAEQWKAAMKTEESRKVVEINNKLVTDESKRSSTIQFNEEYLGMPGSFRRLAVD